MNSSYISEDLRERADDLVWRIRCKGKDDWLYIYLLMEFQRRIDSWMALRILAYTSLLYQDLIRSGTIKGKKPKLPTIFPIVIYNGQGKWTAEREVNNLIEQVPLALKRYQPSQYYFLLEIARVAEKDLQDEHNTVTSLIQLERQKALPELREVIAQLITQLQGTENDSIRKAFTTWLNNVGLKKVFFKEKLPEITELQEINTMLADRIDSWIEGWMQEGMQKGRQEGRQEGLYEGIQKGIQKGKREGLNEGIQKGEKAFLLKQLSKRFGVLPDWAIVRVENATIEQIETWGVRIFEAENLEEMFSNQH
jgi:predicted transposase/invertase (TIGR01784 family)